jgi:hypothetical protein
VGLACLLTVAVMSAAGEEWSSPDSPGTSGAHPTDDCRKSALGSKADPSRTSETRVYGFCEDCRKVYEFATQSRAILALAKILETPWIKHMGMRFLLRPNNPVSDALCLFCNPAREPGNPARCDNALSDGRVGSPANSGVLRLGSIATAVSDSRS